MEKQLLTLAIHKLPKATLLQNMLQKNGIQVFLEPIGEEAAGKMPEGIYVRVNYKDLSRALALIEGSQLFSYQSKSISEIDDGRRRILVAVDFSKYSLKACQMAFDLAKKIDAKVKILHIYNKIYFPTTIPFADTLKDDPDEGPLNDARKLMLDFCYEIESKITNGEWPSINYSYSLREGIVDEEINDFVAEYSPVLLVVGTKGKGNNKSGILGSVTGDIIEITNIPVMAIPDSSVVNTLTDIKHVSFLTSLNKRDMASFDNLMNLIKKPEEVKVSLVHFNFQKRKISTQESEASLEAMKMFLANRYPGINLDYEVIETDDIDNAIKIYISQTKANMIALNTRRRNLFGRIFAPSVSRKLIYETNAVILILRG